MELVRLRQGCRRSSVLDSQSDLSAAVSMQRASVHNCHKDVRTAIALNRVSMLNSVEFHSCVTLTIGNALTA